MAYKKKKKNSVFTDGHFGEVEITDINEKFLNACENGDYQTVNWILSEISNFNIELTDNLGRTPLRLAIENEHLEVVQALLNKSDNSKIRESLLLCIFLGHSQISEAILKHPKYKVLSEKKLLNNDADSFWQTPSSDDAQFSPDTTPIILAAQYNRTEIVQMLLFKGDRIIKPHAHDCKCHECHNRFEFDSLRHAQARLNSYRGLASESYVSLVSADPILTAFELGNELRTLATKEKCFKNEYLQLANNLSMYTVKLLSNVRGRDELDIVLNKTGKETEEKYERLARLDLAIRFKEKPFVAHPNCQQKLDEIWYSGLRSVSKMNDLKKSLISISFLLLLPFLMVVFIFAPKSKVGRFMCQPAIKFTSYTFMYFIFIILIIVSSINFTSELKLSDRFSEAYSAYIQNYSDYAQNPSLDRCRFSNETDFYIRLKGPPMIEIFILVWILGFAWHEIKQLYQDGIKNYLLSGANMMDACMITLYMISFALKYYVYIYVNFQLQKLNTPAFWLRVGKLADSDMKEQMDVFETFYWLNTNRKFWIDFDPLSLAEGLFAVGNLLSIVRLCFLLQAIESIGPLFITLMKMMTDVSKFIFLLLVFILGFCISLYNLFWYYSYDVRKLFEFPLHTNLGDNNDNDITQPNAARIFGTLPKSFGSIFWSLFGLAQMWHTKLRPFDNQVTETFGFLLYAVAHFVCMLVLINMLIGMMTKSYENIHQNSDVEWKFARSELYLEFIKEGGTLPVPFNIVPTPKSFYYLFKNVLGKYRALRRGNSTNDNEPGMSSINRLAKTTHNVLFKFNKKKNEENALTYKIVIQRVVKRFLLHNSDAADVYQRETQEIKHDLQMVRFEMSNAVKLSKESLLKHVLLTYTGVTLLAEEIFRACTSESMLRRFSEFKLGDMNDDEPGSGSGGAGSGENTIQTTNASTITTATTTSTSNPPSGNKIQAKKRFNYQQSLYETVNQVIHHNSYLKIKQSLASSIPFKASGSAGEADSKMIKPALSTVDESFTNLDLIETLD